MNQTRTPDRLLSAWFEVEAPASPPDALRTDIYRATAAIRPRPAWLARLRGNPMDVIAGGAHRRNTRLIPILALLLLTLAVVAGAVYIGRQPGPPPAVVVPSGTPTATLEPVATIESTATPAPAFTGYADYVLSMDYPILQVRDGGFVGIAGPDTNELLRSVYRFNASNGTTTRTVDGISVGPRDHVTFAAYGQHLVMGHDEGGRALRFDATSGEFLGETPLGERPLEPIVFGGYVWFPNFGDGSVTGLDPATGEVRSTIMIPSFNGGGPLSLAAGDDSQTFWAVSPGADTLVGISPDNGVWIEKVLPGGPHCGVGAAMHSYWVTACDGSAKVVFLPDTYVTLTEPVVVDVAPGVSATVFEAGNRVWFTTEDRSAAAWTTKLVPVDRDSLAVGTPIDLGAQVGVVPTTSGVWLTLGTDLYQLRLDSLPRG